MPRAKKSSNPAKDEIVWGGFIDVKLTAEQKAAFAEFEAEFQWTFMDDLLADEIKLSLSYDDNTETYLASMTSVKHAGNGLRCVLTARAGTWERAVMLACYKHFALLEGDWGRYKPGSGTYAEV
jgi:hypothetical protein